jgi:multicomponent Na+:H+ antiporter subunit D
VIVGFGAATALIGAAMSFAQQHLKRLLAYSTISHMGLFTIGFGLVDHNALAGSAVYVLAHGAIKASLFIAAGIVLHRLAGIDEEHLRGRGRSMPFTAALFLLGGLALAELPPFGTFLGKALAEDAAAAEGLSWLPYVFVLVSALVGGAVLKAGAQVFLGWGPRPRPERAQEEGGEPPRGREDRVPRFMLAPPALLLAGALALGVVPGLAGRAVAAAERFQDRRAYAAAVLEGREVAVQAVEPAVPRTKDVLLSLAALAGAGIVAAGALRRPRIVVPGGRYLHSGHVGDYVTWLVVGTAAFGAAFAYVLR